MKKYFSFAFASAIALIGACGFTACSSEDEVAENNPTYDPVKETVTSQFVLNIASDIRNNNSTRSAGTTVQAGGENFRGIDNTVLFAFKTSGKRFVDATLAATAAANRYDLGSLVSSGSLDNDGSNSHRILELAVPTGTDAMLFYGKAMRGTLDNDEAGKVTYTVNNSTATAFNFALNQRVATADNSRFEHTAEVLAAVMTEIINAQSSYTVEKAGDGRIYPDWTGADVLTAAWKDINPTTQGRSLSPLEEILYKTFKTLTTIGGDEMRGGSSRAIITTVQDLRTVILKVANDAVPTSPYEELAQRVASEINTEINLFFTAGAASLKSIGNTKTAFGAKWDNDWDGVDNTEYQDFPVANFHLPEGAAMLEYNATKNKFSHKHPGTSLLDRNATADALAYMFPAELLYYCNSGVRTSNKEKTSSSGFPNGVANWDNNAKWDSDWSGTEVTSATRATAMTKNVNYGVALLKTTVGIKEGLLSLEDNRAALNEGESNNSFSPANIDFTLTGVIVGGQPEAVDWQFLPTANTFNKFVYDNRVTGLEAGTAVPKSAGSASSPNYTILFDNYNSTVTAQNKVRVALQLVNNGDNFWGRDNLIRKGQTFYLVGELDPTGKEITNWDDYYQIPPLTAAGVSTKTTRVFVQDYMTTANFKITSASLQNAFVTLPDLRSSQLSFGLSVDLDWRPGIEFNVELGGN